MGQGDWGVVRTGLVLLPDVSFVPLFPLFPVPLSTSLSHKGKKRGEDRNHEDKDNEEHEV